MDDWHRIIGGRTAPVDDQEAWDRREWLAEELRRTGRDPITRLLREGGDAELTDPNTPSIHGGPGGSPVTPGPRRPLTNHGS